MKLILSRKGFDTGSGGGPSPILPDGSMLSLPIPDPRSQVRYRDLQWQGRDVGELVERLTRGKVRARDRAHHDPDLRADSLPRLPRWRPLLGQVGAAQGHLRNEGVGVGDVFLFWGLFRRVDAALRWSGPPLHVLWGWMQIAAVASVDAVREEPGWAWARRHPHLAFAPDPTNTLYGAAAALDAIDPALPGAGVFARFDEARLLTAAGADSPTRWSLPGWFLPRRRLALSYHRAPARWSQSGERAKLQTVSRGQEFVLDGDAYPQARAWVAGLVTATRPQARPRSA